MMTEFRSFDKGVEESSESAGGGLFETYESVTVDEGV